MKSTIMHSILKWIVGSATGLITIPVAILAIIVSIYSDLFKEDSKSHGKNKFQIKTYYEYFEEQKRIATINGATSTIDIKDDTAKYCHILIIDRTLSTDQDNKNLSSFYNYVDSLLANPKGKYSINSNNIIKVNKPNKEKPDWKLTIKHLLILRFYLELIVNTNAEGIIVGFFDGKVMSFPEYTKTGPIETNSLGQEYRLLNDQKSRINLVADLCKEELLKKESGQISDFRIMFDEINVLCGNPTKTSDGIILTIVSDFDHEGTDIEKSAIENFKKNNEAILQYNIIYCPPLDTVKRRKSNELIKNLSSNIKGVDHLVTIDLKNYENDRYNIDLVREFNNDLLKCLYRNKKDSSSVDFYHPKPHMQHNMKTAKAWIDVRNNEKHIPYEWRFTTEISQKEDKELFMFYAINADNNKRAPYSINDNWREFSGNDSLLLLNIGLNSKLGINQYNFEVKHEKTFESHPVVIHEYMTGYIADLGTLILHIFCIFTLVFVFSGTLLVHLKIFQKANNRMWIISIILIIILLWFLLKIFWFGKYFCPTITSVIICVCGISLPIHYGFKLIIKLIIKLIKWINKKLTQLLAYLSPNKNSEQN
jgi:hypothetical protein